MNQYFKTSDGIYLATDQEPMGEFILFYWHDAIIVVAIGIYFATDQEPMRESITNIDLAIQGGFARYICSYIAYKH